MTPRVHGMDKLFPSTFTPEEREGKRQTPVKRDVEYIHPERRYVTIRFTFDSGKSFCESFSLRRDHR